VPCRSIFWYCASISADAVPAYPPVFPPNVNVKLGEPRVAHRKFPATDSEAFSSKRV